MAKYVPVVKKDFSRGQNDTSAIENLKDNELVIARNLDLSIRGGFSIRLGCTRHTEVALAPTPVSRLFRLGNTDLVVTGAYVKKWDGTNVHTTLNSPDIDYGIMNQKAYYVDGTEYWELDPATWTAVAVTPAAENTLAAVKRCKYMAQRGRRFYFAGDPQGKNDIIFTEPGKPNDIGKDLNVLQIVPDDNDEIIGLSEFHKAMIIFKQFKVYGWFGTDPSSGATVEELAVHDGTVAQRTIVKTPKALMCYLSGDGVIAMRGTEDGMVTAWTVSKNIANTIRRLTNLDKAVATFYKGLLLIACCDDGTGINNKVLVGFTDNAYMDESGDLQFPWSIWDGWHVNEWYRGVDRKLYFGDARSCLIYKAFDGYNDDGEIIVAEAELKNYDVDTPFNLKRVPYVFIYAKQYGMPNPSMVNINVKGGYREVNINANFNANLVESAIWGDDSEEVMDEFQWDDGSLWGWQDSVRKRITTNFRTHFVSFRFKMETLDNLVTIYGIGIPTKLKKASGSTTGIELVERT